MTRRPGELHRALSPVVLAVALVLLLAGCGSLTRARASGDGGFAPATWAEAASEEGGAAERTPIVEDEPSTGVSPGTDADPYSSSLAPVAFGEEQVPAAFAALAPEVDREVSAGTTAVAVTVAQAAGGEPNRAADGEPDEFEPYDPLERFNERMFTFNYNVDRYVLKPVATAYNKVVPDPLQVMIANGFENIKVVPRIVNNLLQAKWSGAGVEAARFLINSTAGIGGLFDPARDYWNIARPPREDFGQTLGRWGVGPGPFLVLPFLEPTTVRDGIGRGVDTVMNPLTYVVSFIWAGLGMTLGEVVNDRSLNLELFQGFEDTVVDLYSAVRHSYLQRRARQIRQ